MGKKGKKNDSDAMVYSTNPETMSGLFSGILSSSEEKEEVMSKSEEVRVWIDRKRRGGKKAVVIKGIKGTNRQLTEIATFLKTKCGVGGAAKDGEIIIQGDQREKIIKLLNEKGYGNVKAAGG